MAVLQVKQTEDRRTTKAFYFFITVLFENLYYFENLLGEIMFD